jgi:DNA-binding response OmpR family regulator
MKVLLAEDEAVSRRLMEVHLDKWGFKVIGARDGAEAWVQLQQQPDIEMAVLDWMMPEIDGVDLVHRIRNELPGRSLYVIVCTARAGVEDLVTALDAGADDYLAKPFRQEELRARLRVGVRTVALERALRRRIADLDAALRHVRTLQGLLPICMHCKKIRNEEDIWERLESYIEEHADVEFSHGLCDECLAKTCAGAKADA